MPADCKPRFRVGDGAQGQLQGQLRAPVLREQALGCPTVLWSYVLEQNTRGRRSQPGTGGVSGGCRTHAGWRCLPRASLSQAQGLQAPSCRSCFPTLVSTVLESPPAVRRSRVGLKTRCLWRRGVTSPGHLRAGWGAQRGDMEHLSCLGTAPAQPLLGRCPHMGRPRGPVGQVFVTMEVMERALVDAEVRTEASCGQGIRGSPWEDRKLLGLWSLQPVCTSGVLGLWGCTLHTAPPQWWLVPRAAGCPDVVALVSVVGTVSASAVWSRSPTSCHKGSCYRSAPPRS